MIRSMYMKLQQEQKDQRLKRGLSILRKEGVAFAYLFGSQAQGRTILSSDVDIATYIGKGTPRARFAARLRLIRNLSKAFGVPADVTMLDDVRSVAFRFTVIKEGYPIVVRDEGKRLDFELKTMREYEEFAPFLRLYNTQYLAHAI